MDHNQLSGVLPTYWDAPQLARLDLQHNGFSGEEGREVAWAAAVAVPESAQSLLLQLPNKPSVCSIPPHAPP